MSEIALDLIYTDAQSEIFFGKHKKYNIVTKGRRFGFTRGAGQALVEYAIDGIPFILWGDTINGNIDRYYERYILPVLKKMPAKYWKWNQQKRELSILDTKIDFRSADRPENWEGFGYNIIILNEAGIILEDNYLYLNAILPMMLDYPDSILIAGGVPKGQLKKDGSEHKFYTLFKQAQANQNYRLLQYTSYDNPFLNKEDIAQLEDEYSLLGEQTRDQEILGLFVESTGSNPFMVQYSKEKHEAEVKADPYKQLLISIDFNLNPFAVSFAHYFRDSQGEHFYIVDETSIPNGSVPVMIDYIRENYGSQLHSCLITGDSMGKNGNISERDNASHYTLLQRGLGLRDTQIKVPNNPKHSNSRTDCNFVLKHFPDFKINPKCAGTCRDMISVQCDAFGEILKKDRKNVSQRADHLDCVRYMINTFLRKWIDTNMKFKK
jgi:hypothetical protein